MSVGVALGVTVGVFVSVAVALGVTVAVLVGVFVNVAVAVGVFVDVLVEVGVGLARPTTSMIELRKSGKITKIRTSNPINKITPIMVWEFDLDDVG